MRFLSDLTKQKTFRLRVLSRFSGAIKRQQVEEYVFEACIIAAIFQISIET